MIILVTLTNNLKINENCISKSFYLSFTAWLFCTVSSNRDTRLHCILINNNFFPIKLLSPLLYLFILMTHPSNSSLGHGFPQSSSRISSSPFSFISNNRIRNVQKCWARRVQVAKRTEIRDFDNFFNAITGLNGSGKSNVLDSICFLLGISRLSQVGLVIFSSFLVFVSFQKKL